MTSHMITEDLKSIEDYIFDQEITIAAYSSPNDRFRRMSYHYGTKTYTIEIAWTVDGKDKDVYKTTYLSEAVEIYNLK